MGIEEQTPMKDAFESAIMKAFRQGIDEVVKSEIEKAKERLEERVKMLADEISVKLLSQVTFDRFGTDLVIKVDTKDLKL